MREIRQSGSEGGAGQTNVPFLPLSERLDPVGPKSPHGAPSTPTANTPSTNRAPYQSPNSVILSQTPS